MGEPLLPGQVRIFSQQSVCYNLIMERGCHDKFAGSFVRRMVYYRQPVPGPVRPVVTKKGPVTELILRNHQPVGRNAGVDNGKRLIFSFAGRSRQRNPQHMIGVGKRHFLSVAANFTDGHTGSGWFLSFSDQVQPQFLHPRLRELCCYFGLGHNAVGRITQREAKNVMLHIYASLRLGS